MYYTAVASPRVCCATIIIHTLTAASSELARARLRFNMLVLLLLLLLLLVVVVCATVCGSAELCGRASGSVLAVRAAVCNSKCTWSCMYGSARGSVRHRHCAAVRNSMRQCVRQYAAVCGSVW